MERSQSANVRSEEHTSELQSRRDIVCRLLLEKKKTGRAVTGDALSGDRFWGQVRGFSGRLRASQGRVEPDKAKRLLAGKQGGYLFFFNDPATTEIYTLSLHDALPI